MKDLIDLEKKCLYNAKALKLYLKFKKFYICLKTTIIFRSTIFFDKYIC